MLLTIPVTAGLFALAALFAVRAFGLDPDRRRHQAYDQLLTGRAPAATLTVEDAPAGIQAFVLAVFDDIVTVFGSASARVEERLRLAGSGMTADRFRIRQIIGVVLGGTAGAVLGILTGSTTLLILLVGCCGFAGSAWPRAALEAEIRRREEQVWTSLPEVINFLSICHAAGQPVEGAVETVTNTASGPVVDTLSRVLRRFRTGWPLSRAFEDAARGETLQSAKDLYASLAEGVRNSGNIQEILAAQTETLRMAQKVKLEDALARRESRMLWPFIAFVLPPIAAIAVFVMFGAMQNIF